ncbi:hypothetical protein VTK56DRAFT_8905 [Thermocarpiscus australiensis]
MSTFGATVHRRPTDFEPDKRHYVLKAYYRYSIMPESEVIDDLIGLRLKQTIMAMKTTIEEQDRRISGLEMKIRGIEMNENRGRPKITMAMPPPDAMKHTTSEAPVPITNSAMDGYMNRGLNAAVFSVTNRMAFKSNSAISIRGYNIRLNLWGTVLASLMIACMKRYVQKAGETGLVIDETMVINTYRRRVGVPQGERRSKDKVQDTTLQTWSDLERTQTATGWGWPRPSSTCKPPAGWSRTIRGAIYNKRFGINLILGHYIHAGRAFRYAPVPTVPGPHHSQRLVSRDQQHGLPPPLRSSSPDLH